MPHRITIQTPTKTKNALHEPVTTWANLASTPTIWSRIEPVTGMEQLEANKLTATTTVRITIRPRSDLTSEMRIIHGATTYQIDYIEPYDPHRDMIITAHTTT